MPTSKAHGHRLFVEIQLHFRYASLSPLHMYQFQSAFHFIKLQGAEAEEFSNIPFKKMVVVASQELFPLGNGPNQIPHVFTNWQVLGHSVSHHHYSMPIFKYFKLYFLFIKQTALCKKMANMQGICPFKLEFPQGSPPSLVVAGPAGVSGEPW